MTRLSFMDLLVEALCRAGEPRLPQGSHVPRGLAQPLSPRWALSGGLREAWNSLNRDYIRPLTMMVMFSGLKLKQ